MLTRMLKWSIVPAAAITTTYLYNRFRATPATLVPAASISLAASLSIGSHFYRSNDWTHLYYAAKVYQEDGGKLLPGWKRINIHSAANSYFGAAYLNEAHKHIIIAHRGTQDLKDWLSNADFITRRLNEQQVSAWDDFAKKIVEQHGRNYQYSFTGHSLGGWLAQTCLWKFQDEFVKGKVPAYPDAFAVTLDDPGAKELLEALQPRVDSGYKIDIDRLDITSYLSHPNIVNTALGHVGSTYALSPKLALSWLQHQTIYTLKAHSAKALLDEEFSDNGLPKDCTRVIDWPKVLWGSPLSSADKTKGVLGYLAQMLKAYVKGDIDREEYLGFFAYKAESLANPEQLPTASRFQLRHGIHYDVRPFDEQVLPLRNMPSAVRRFLEDLSEYLDRKKIEHLVSNAGNPQLLAALQVYQINEYQELVVDKKAGFTARDFRNELLGFLNENPRLCQSKLAVLWDEHHAKRLQAVETGTIPGILADFREQSQRTQNLIEYLSFQQGTAKLYKFIKPTWEEVEQLKTEHSALKSQLTILQSLRLNVQSQKLEAQVKTEIDNTLEQQRQQLEVAELSVNTLLYYMEGQPLAEEQVNTLITTLKSSTALSNQNQLLNRAYNLKAKIAVSQGNQKLAIDSYEKATQLLPEDALTWSNFGGLLSDMGRASKDVSFHVRAYECYQKVYPRLSQIGPKQRSIVKSGMAYGFLLLAQNLEQKTSVNPAVPSVKELRAQAGHLLIEAIDNNPNYLNARLFQAILFYDEKDYRNSLAAIHQVLGLQPVHPTALMRKGFILEKLGNLDEAISFLSQAKKILSKSQKGNENSGWIQEIDETLSTIEAQKTPRYRP